MLQSYTVLDATPLLAGQALCLRDNSGRYHVARTTAEVPALGQRLSGRAPAIGFAMLMDAATGQVFRIVFESLGCGQLQALELLRGAQPDLHASTSSRTQTPKTVGSSSGCHLAA